MPLISIKGIPEDRLSFFGIEKVSESGSYLIYEDSEGRVSVADKDNPYVWVDDISDAIQLGSSSIVSRE